MENTGSVIYPTVHADGTPSREGKIEGGFCKMRKEGTLPTVHADGTPSREGKRILGIDPGLLHTGWAVIESVGSARHYIASGVILAPTKQELPKRLAYIFRGVRDLCNQFQPDECSIEITFVNKNPTTTLILGHARAAAMVAVADCEIPVFEYEPNKIKKTLTCAGHADKEQVYKMVRMLLPAANPKTPDESDALAIALTHANTTRFV